MLGVFSRVPQTGQHKQGKRAKCMGSEGEGNTFYDKKNRFCPIVSSILLGEAIVLTTLKSFNYQRIFHLWGVVDKY